MNRCIRRVILRFFIINTHVVFAAGQAASPWESTESAENFIASFLKTIAWSGAFSSSQLNDMYTIRQTIPATREKLEGSDTGSKSKFQTLNVAFASVMVDVVVAEEGRTEMEAKINAIKNALGSAFLETDGAINTEFVSEITNLIYTLARTTVNRVSSMSDAKLGGYKQKPVEQQGPADSISTTETNGPVPQPPSQTEQQGSSVLESSGVSNKKANNESSLQEPSITRPQESPLQIPSKPKASKSTAVSNMRGNVPIPSGSGSQVLSVLGLQRPSDYAVEIGTSAGTGVRIGKQAPVEPMSQITKQRGSEDNVLLEKGASSAGLTKTGDKESNGKGLGTEIDTSAGAGVRIGRQAPAEPMSQITKQRGSEDNALLGKGESAGLRKTGDKEPNSKGLGAEIDTSAGTGVRVGRQVPAEPMSQITKQRDSEDSVLLGKGASNAGLTKTGDKEPNSYGLGAASTKSSYALLSTARRPQGTSGLEGKGMMGRQELSGSSNYVAKATASAAASGSESSTNGKVPQGSSEFTKLKPDARDKLPGDYRLGNSRSEMTAKVPSGGYRSVEKAGIPQESRSQKPTGKEAVGSRVYERGAAGIGSSVPSSGYKIEKQVERDSTRIGNRKQEQARQKLGSLASSGTEGLGPDGYQAKATSTPASAYELGNSKESQEESVISGQETPKIYQAKATSTAESVTGLGNSKESRISGQESPKIYQAKATSTAESVTGLGNSKESRISGQESPKIYQAKVTSTAASAYGLGNSKESQGESVISGQESPEIREQKPSTRKPPVLEGNAASTYGRATAAAGGYGSSTDLDGRQGPGQTPSPPKEIGLISRKPYGPTTQGREGYALKTAEEQYGPIGPVVVSQVSSSDSSFEVSSTASSRASSKPATLSNSFNNIMSQIDPRNTHLFSCDILVQTLLEIISSLVHILESCSTGRFNFGSSAQYSAATSQSSAQIKN